METFYDFAIFFCGFVPIAAACCDCQIKRQQPAHTLIAFCKTIFKLFLEYTAHGCNKTKDRDEDAGKSPAAVF